MKNKSLIFAASAFVVLGILFVMQEGKKKGVVPEVSSKKLITEEISPNDVARVKLHFPFLKENTLEFVKKESGWVVASRFGGPAKTDKIDAVLEEVGKLKGEFRSDSSEVLADYDLAEETAMHLEFYGSDDKELLNLLIGKRAETQNEVFLRLSGSNRVLKVSTSLRAKLGIFGEDMKEMPATSEWLELSMLKFDRDGAGELTMTANGVTTQYSKKEKAREASEEDKKGEEKKVEYIWEPDGGMNGAATRSGEDAKNAIGTLANFHAEDLMGRGNLENFDLKPAPYIAKVVLKDNKEYELKVGKKIEGKEKRFAAVGGSDFVYSIGNYQFESVFGKEEGEKSSEESK